MTGAPKLGLGGEKAKLRKTRSGRPLGGLLTRLNILASELELHPNRIADPVAGAIGLDLDAQRCWRRSSGRDIQLGGIIVLIGLANLIEGVDDQGDRLLRGLQLAGEADAQRAPGSQSGEVPAGGAKAIVDLDRKGAGGSAALIDHLGTDRDRRAQAGSGRRESEIA